MLHSINEIDLSKNNDTLDLYPLFKTASKETNQKISTILKKYSDSPEFFSRYTQKDIPSLLKILSNLDKKYQEIQSSISKNFEGSLEEYISNISKIILLLNLLYKNHSLIVKAMGALQSFLTKVNNDNLPLQKFLNHIKSFKFKHIQFMETRNNKTMINFRNVPRNITKDTTTIKSNTNLSNLSGLTSRKFEPDNESEKQTPKFQGQEKTLRSSYNNEYNKKDTSDSILSLSNMVFSNGTNTESINNINTTNNNVKTSNNNSKNKGNNSKNINKNKNNNNNNNNDNNHIMSTQENVHIERKHKRNKTSIVGNFTGNQKELFLPKIRTDKRRCSQLSCPNFDVSDKIKMYSELLELVNYMYKNCQINAEERVKIKQLIISKSKKVEDVYLSYGNKNIRDDIQKFVTKLKEMI